MARECIANSKPPLVARSRSSCCAEPLVSESRSLQLGQPIVLQLYDCKRQVPRLYINLLARMYTCTLHAGVSMTENSRDQGVDSRHSRC